MEVGAERAARTHSIWAVRDGLPQRQLNRHATEMSYG